SENELKIALIENSPQFTSSEKSTIEVVNVSPTKPTEKPKVDLNYNKMPGAVEATAVECLEALFFTVQVGVYNRPVRPDQLSFDELFTSRSEKGQIRYSSGKFQSVEAAKNKRKEAVEKGVADAFIVAYYQGKRITIAEANQ